MMTDYQRLRELASAAADLMESRDPWRGLTARQARQLQRWAREARQIRDAAANDEDWHASQLIIANYFPVA